MKKTLAVLFIVLLLGGLSGCSEKTVIQDFGSEYRHTDEEFFSEPELVVKATVKEKVREYFTDPESKTEIAFNNNAHITVFELEISEVLRGEWGEETLQLKMFNGYGMSPDLYLYGKDETTVMSEKIEPFLLEPGREYLLGLVYTHPGRANCYNDEGGYVIRWGKTWCFTQGEDGIYRNWSGANFREMTLEEIQNGLAAYP